MNQDSAPDLRRSPRGVGPVISEPPEHRMTVLPVGGLNCWQVAPNRHITGTSVLLWAIGTASLAVPTACCCPWFSYSIHSLHFVTRILTLLGSPLSHPLSHTLNSTLPWNWRKKRIHFHDFMLNVHTHLQMHKGVADPLEAVAAEISDESILLCLDEFMVNDVADALILNRLFKHLFDKGVVLVSTSNRAPDNLYEGGLQRDLFLPFIETLKERCVIHEIGSSTDYRRMSSAEHGFYFVGNEHSELLKQKFNELIGDAIPGPQIVDVPMGRQLQVPLGAKGCAYFPFEELCDRPLSAADYFGLFKRFHTLALEGVPKFGLHNRTAAYRFVTLVDVMYENKARLLCTADASPVELFERIVTVGEAQKISPRSSSRSEKKDDIDLCVDNDIGFVKDRTISR